MGTKTAIFILTSMIQSPYPKVVFVATAAVLLKGVLCLLMEVMVSSKGNNIISHFTPLHFHFTSLLFTPLHSTSLHSASLYFTPVHSTSLHFTPLHFIPVHFTSLHFTSLHFTLLYSSPLHSSPLPKERTVPQKIFFGCCSVANLIFCHAPTL